MNSYTSSISPATTPLIAVQGVCVVLTGVYGIKRQVGWTVLLAVKLTVVFSFIWNKNAKEGRAVRTTWRDSVQRLQSQGACFLFICRKFRISPRTEASLLICGVNWEQREQSCCGFMSGLTLKESLCSYILTQLCQSGLSPRGFLGSAV